MIWGLIDKVTDWKEGQYGRALYNIPMTHSLFRTHFPKKPAWPGVLTILSTQRLAEGVIISESDFQEYVRLRRLKGVSWPNFISPGSQINIEVHIIQKQHEAIVAKAHVKSGNKSVMKVKEIEFVRCGKTDASVPLIKKFWSDRMPKYSIEEGSL